MKAIFKTGYFTLQLIFVLAGLVFGYVKNISLVTGVFGIMLGAFLTEHKAMFTLRR
jgi:hypothetical protein